MKDPRTSRQGCLRRGIAAASLFIVAASAAAQATNPANPAAAPAPAADDVVTLSPFTVSSADADGYLSADAISAVRVRAPLLDTPSTISVLTRSMLDDLGPTRVFDAARYVAGVQEGRGVQFQDRMIIRGFETQNGARTVDNFLQPADADNVEESIIDRIEITKGPNAILAPSGAPGGSLNIITKSPNFQAKRSFTATIGQFDAQKFMFDLTGPVAGSKSLAYRLIYSGQDTEMYFSDDARRHNTTLAPMMTWRISDRTQLTVKLIASEHWIFREPLLIVDPNTTATTKDPQIAPGFSKRDRNGIQPWSHVDTHSADFFAVLTSTLNSHWDLRAALNGRYYFEDSDQNFLSTPGLSSRYNPTTGQLTQDYTWALANTSAAYNATTNPYVATFSPFYNPGNIPNRGQIQWSRRKTANVQADVVGKYQFGEVSSQTVFGVAWSRQTAYNRSKDPGTMPGIDLGNKYREVYPVYPANLTGHNGSSYTNEQVYLNQRFGLFNNRLYLTGGAMRYSTTTKAWNILTGAAPGVLDDSKNMWSLSALYKVRDNVSVYVSRSNNASPVIANNQPLWRSGKQDEFGIKSDFLNKKLSVNAAYFKISQTNVTVPNPAYQTDPTQPQQLVSDLSNKGYELELTGSLTSNLSAIATYSHLNMRDSLGRMVRGVADNNASLLLNYNFKDGAVKGLNTYFGTSYSGRRAGDVPDGNFTQLNVVKQVSFYLKPQYTTILGLSYRWNEMFHTRLTIDNVFDKKGYISVAGGRVIGSGLSVQEGRNIRLTTTISF